MSNFQKWLLRWLLRDLMACDFPQDRMVPFFGLVREAYARQFYEDNQATQDSVLCEWLSRSQS